MMNKLNLLTLLAVIAAILIGCADLGNKESMKSMERGTTQPPIGLVAGDFRADEDISRIAIAKSYAHGVANTSGAVEYTDKATIDMIVQAIRSAVPIEGILNTATPDYDIVLTSANKQESAFHLWINETIEQAMIMDVSETHTGYTLTEDSTAELKKIIFAYSSFKGLEFRTERTTDGDLVATPIGLSEIGYMLNGGPVAKLHGITYHTVHLFYGDHNAINALVAHNPSTDEVQVRWSDKLSSYDNRWNNAFMSSYNLLLPLDEDRLLFLESELTETAGYYHLSAYNAATGAVERLRENFWPLTDQYDYIYKHQWNAREQKLFMQSYLGNVWIFDLKTGEDDVHLLKYRVIPHSTTGAPSLFLAPTFERFVHDDESGHLTFYNNQGTPLHTVALPPEQSEDDQKRILDVDIDYLKIAPQQINFYDPDGLPVGTVRVEGSREGATVEVAGWMDTDVAVIKSYTVGKETDVSFFLYDVRNQKRGKSSSSIPADAIVASERQAEGTGNIAVSYEEIKYRLEK